jgi:hypothetical protein
MVWRIRDDLVNKITVTRLILPLNREQLKLSLDDHSNKNEITKIILVKKLASFFLES